VRKSARKSANVHLLVVGPHAIKHVLCIVVTNGRGSTMLTKCGEGLHVVILWIRLQSVGVGKIGSRKCESDTCGWVQEL